MKQFFRLAWLILSIGLLIACGNVPPEGVVTDVEQEVVDAAENVVVEAEESQPEPTAEAKVETTIEIVESEEVEAEEEEPAVVAAADGPTHIPATTIEQALVERAYDQAKGADSPILTVIEYGDFQ